MEGVTKDTFVTSPAREGSGRREEGLGLAGLAGVGEEGSCLGVLIMRWSIAPATCSYSSCGGLPGKVCPGGVGTCSGGG